jgi:hypothetical protein
MSQNELPLTSNKLAIANPLRFYGLIQVVLACFLGVILLVRLPALVPQVMQVASALQPNPDPALQDPKVVGIIVQGVFALAALVLVLVNAIQGLNNMLNFFVPTGVPKGIASAAEVVPKLFVDRAITSYTQPGGMLRLASALFSRRLLYTTSSQRSLVEDFIKCVPKWLVIFVIAFLVRLPSGLFLTLLAAGVFSMLVRLFALLAYIPPVPDVQVVEQREQLDNSGNPINFFNFLQRTTEQLREGNFPNRRLAETPPSITRTSKGETDKFESELIVETQPLPVEQLLGKSAVTLDLGGALLRCAGYGTLLFGSIPQGEGIEQIWIRLIMQVGVGWVTIRTGTKLLNMGLSLHKVFRFHSDLIHVKLTGSYTTSGIGIGDGRGGQLFSERVVVQSDSYLCLWGSHLVTECVGLDAERAIVDAQINDGFRARFDHVRGAMLSYRDSGSRLAEIDLTARSVASIAQANSEINALGARATAGAGSSLLGNRAGQPPLIPAGVPPTPVPEAGTDSKLCPDCGEQVKAVARKCRFCGYRFDERSDAKA